MLFFVTGVSGAGKSSVIPTLRQRLPDMHIYDFDLYPDREQIGTLDSTEQRQRVAERWLQQAIANGTQHTVICGLGVMGEVLACPSAPLVDHIAFCLLDCDDLERLDRLQRRGDTQDKMAILCWSAWLRVHHIDPQFRQDVINTGTNDAMVWSRWADWQRGHPAWRCARVDTTQMTIPAVAERVVEWIESEV